MNLSERDGITFDDVLLVPKYSEIQSRKKIDTKIKISNNVTLNVPIISANMDSITEDLMAIEMARIGGLGIIHRYCTIQKQCEFVKNVKIANYDGYANPTLDRKRRLVVGASIGTKAIELQRLNALVKEDVDFICIDVAHGHHKNVIEFIKEIKINFKNYNFEIIAGNVATFDGAYDLFKAGADIVKAGVGGGSCCSTRIIAGSGMPQLSAIDECVQAKRIHYSDEKFISVIADGGIRNSGDIAKAIAVGANSVMLGSLLSGTAECPGNIIEKDGNDYKIFRGMASLEANKNREDFDWDEENYVPEGVSTEVPYKGYVLNIILQLLNGLKSGMSYSGSNNILEFQQRYKFIKISENSRIESHPHIFNKK